MSGNMPETYNTGSARIREGDSKSAAISETGAANAFKEHDDDQRIQYTRNELGQINGLTSDGFTAFRVIQMYKGSTIQDKTP